MSVYVGIVYLIGFISWSLAAVVLKREYERNIPQSLWTHRFFWIFSGTFAVTKMFEDYLLPLNFVFNCISLISTFTHNIRQYCSDYLQFVSTIRQSNNRHSPQLRNPILRQMVLRNHLAQCHNSQNIQNRRHNQNK